MVRIMINVTVVIPHYQKQNALEKTWSELQLQLAPDDEVLIVDDHSPDGVPDFDCNCTRVVRPQKRTPHIYRLNTLRNTGVIQAENDCVVILDPDCIPNPRFLDHVRRVYDVGVLFGGWINYMNEDGYLLKKDPRNRNGGGSRWCDRSHRGCGMIWGGCMMFSKRRASLVGLFDTAFDGNWGAEEHEFASRMWHSGVRLRYEKRLMVYHQWHPKVHYGEPDKNRALLGLRKDSHLRGLSHCTPYRPSVAVLVVSTHRPYYIEQCLRGVFRHRFPVKVSLVSNGDDSKTQKEAVSYWKDRWAVDYVEHKNIEPLSKIRNHALQKYKDKGYKYLVLVDDDILIKPGHLTRLLEEAGKHPEYYAVSGYITSANDSSRQIGGRVVNGQHYYYSPVTPVTREADYVSSGFTAVNLSKPLALFSEDWGMGWADWDWSMNVKQMGYRVATTGKAGAYHRVLFTSKGKEEKPDPPEYDRLRRNREEHTAMAKKYKEKWGYLPVNPKAETLLK